MTEPMIDRVANDARNVITAHGMLGQLCAVVWLQDGHMTCLAPQGHADELALMLYRGADTFADLASDAGVRMRD